MINLTDKYKTRAGWKVKVLSLDGPQPSYRVVAAYWDEKSMLLKYASFSAVDGKLFSWKESPEDLIKILRDAAEEGENVESNAPEEGSKEHGRLEMVKLDAPGDRGVHQPTRGD